MRTLKLLSLFALGILLSHCGTTEPTTDTPTRSMLDVARILDTVHGKFDDIALANLSATPQQVLVMTADWIKTQPNVTDVEWLDSSYIRITMQSGLKGVFMINIVGPDSISLTRGGSKHPSGNDPLPLVKANHVITNKSVLLFSPFVGRSRGDLYSKGELDELADKIRTSGKGISVTVLENDECTVEKMETFQNYGIVILDTHGLPDCFVTGHVIHGLSILTDTTDASIRNYMNSMIPDGYAKALRGEFLFADLHEMGNFANWQKYLSRKQNYDIDYLLFATSEFVSHLPAMTGTIIVGNMCYSGWNNVGTVTKPGLGKYIVTSPIKKAFTSRSPIAYYSYGFPDGTSDIVDNDFGKQMEDTLLRSLIIDGDSTGNAYLNASGDPFTPRQTLNHNISRDLPFTLTGSNDYGFDDCVNVFTDNRDGNIYKAVCIGKQVWMAENLRYNAPGSSTNYYGRFYDATVVNDICPKGWHVPDKAEWLQLFDKFGGTDKAGGALKSTGSWDPPNLGATNLSGFTALPGGFYHAQAGYRGEYSEAWFSTSTLDTNSRPLAITLHRSNISVGIVPANPTDQVSCRCLKD